MPKKFDPKELVTFKELMIANSMELEALTQFLFEKGLLVFYGVFEKLKEVKKNYNNPL